MYDIVLRELEPVSDFHLATFVTGKVCTMRTAVELERRRLGYTVVIIVCAIFFLGTYLRWWAPGEIPLIIAFFALLGSWWGRILTADKLPDAYDREKQAWAAKQKYEKERALTLEARLNEVREVARAKAVAVARSDYPDMIDEDMLVERGWPPHRDGSEYDLIDTHLDPPEIVLKYCVEDRDEERTLNLYARSRVETAEEEDEVADEIRSNLYDREQLRKYKEAEETEAREQAEAEALEEQQEKERKARFASQKVVRLDERLKTNKL